ncbi:MAG TPA: YqiA/YcfP family alpha/beta fold hydrolase, partial [Cellvibrio sp.]
HEEVMAVYDELGKLGYKKIIAIGGSFGGYMAALLASKRELACLVLRAPANYPDDELETPYRDTAAGMKAEAHRIFRKSIDVHFWNSATEGVANHNGYTYVIEHAEDEVIDSSIPKSYFNAAKHGNYILIPGVKHSPKQMPNPEHYYQLIEMWIETIVKAIKHSTYDQ